jgi:hypothetical protein
MELPKRNPGKIPQWMIDRADKRDMWLDPDDGRVKHRSFYRGDLVKLVRARKEDAESYLASPRGIEEMAAHKARHRK